MVSRKNKIRGPFRPGGRGGQDEMVPGPFQNTFLFSNPSLRTIEDKEKSTEI